MKIKKSILKPVVRAILISAMLTFIASSSLLESANMTVCDALYQTGDITDEEIIIVGIDQQALEKIGPYNQWGRDVVARTLEKLNKSEDCHPAAIGIDVLYIGESQKESDEQLVEAAGLYDNVVVACAATFGESFIETKNGFYLDKFAITVFEEPFQALKDVTTLGCINSMIDRDGVLRHHMLELNLPDGRVISSLPLALAQKYKEFKGEVGEVNKPFVDSHNFWYLPFYGSDGTFEEVSLESVLSEEIPADYFADKIVLIGPYAVGLQDSFITAVDHAQVMHGVEYQANALQAILRENYKIEVNTTIQFTVLFIILALSFIGFWRREVKSSTAIWAISSLGWIGICKIAYELGYILHVIWVPSGITILYAGCLAVNYIQEAIERRQVTSTFKRYVAPEIVNELLQQEDTSVLELGGKTVNIAVLFVDVRGFTTMSEMLEPSEVVEILNKYLTLISDCILKNKGTLDKFVGDAAMAFWGAPLPQEDYIMNAVKAASDMVKGSEALSVELMNTYGRTVSFGIGVHVGDAVVGNIGSPERMDYTAIGDTVNTAARLEANAPGGTIYISRAVADALEGRIKTTSLGSTIKLKGKKDGFEILTMTKIL